MKDKIIEVLKDSTLSSSDVNWVADAILARLAEGAEAVYQCRPKDLSVWRDVHEDSVAFNDGDYVTRVLYALPPDAQAQIEEWEGLAGRLQAQVETMLDLTERVKVRCETAEAERDALQAELAKREARIEALQADLSSAYAEIRKQKRCFKTVFDRTVCDAADAAIAQEQAK